MARWCGGPGRTLISGSRRHNVRVSSSSFLPQRHLHAAVPRVRHRPPSPTTGMRKILQRAGFGCWFAYTGPGSAVKQPSRPADGGLSRRGSSCLPSVRREAHLWLACVCHIPEVEPDFFLQLLPLGAYILFRVRVSVAQSGRRYSHRRGHVEQALRAEEALLRSRRSEIMASPLQRPQKRRWPITHSLFLHTRCYKH